MKLFDNQVSSVSSTTSVASNEVKAQKSVKSGKTLKRNKIKTEKEAISSDEIRQKLAANVEMSNTAKSKTIANSQKLGEGFLSENLPAAKKIQSQILVKKEEIEANKVKSDDPNTKDHIIKSDVGLNDPSDTTTTEKLKTVLSKGAFNFNTKERDILDKLLSDN